MQAHMSKAKFYHSNVLAELDDVIEYVSHLCHPWEPADWDWDDGECIRYFGNIYRHYKQDHSQFH